jgi:hypothetical protein
MNGIPENDQSISRSGSPEARLSRSEVLAQSNAAKEE